MQYNAYIVFIQLKHYYYYYKEVKVGGKVEEKKVEKKMGERSGGRSAGERQFRARSPVND